jgi:16S rRNA (cytidine1402-2'-O)-methyltransferase
LKSGDVALISDAGTPTISDPGFELVVAAIENGYQVTPLPGPSAITTALSASGLSTKAFTFLGFLQRNHQTKVINQLTQFCNREETLILYESPTRLNRTLDLLRSILGNRSAVVANDLTKMFEEFRRGSLEELINYYESHPVRGEVTIIVDGQISNEIETWTEARVRAEIQKAIAKGTRRSIAAKEISKLSGWSRQSIYNLLGNEEN